MTIHETIKAGIPEALKARDEVRLRTLRSLTTAMTNEVVAKKRKPDEFLADEEALVVLKRASNQRKDSIEQFEKAGRDELAVGEKAELAVIETFLPAMMSKEDVVKAVKAKQEELGITDKTKAGMLMSQVMKDLKGQAEGADVKEAVDALF
jgi:uncharacterized protein YqeY